MIIKLYFLLFCVLALADTAEEKLEKRDAYRTRAKEILNDLSYQRALPSPGARVGGSASPPRAPARAKGSRKEKRIAEPKPAPPPQEKHSPLPTEGISVLVRIILYLALALAGGYCLLLLIVHFRKQSQISQARTASLSRKKEAGGKTVSPVLSSIEKLASGGKYKEAVHEMLLLAIRYLAERRKGPLAESLTSRELIRFLPGTKDEKSRFQRLVVAVERSLFGGQQVDRAAYANCLHAFQSLVP